MAMARNNSLRRQLLMWLLWPVVLILLAGFVIAYLFALDAAENAYDLGLLDNALDLSKQVEVVEGQMRINLPLAAQQMLQANNEDRVSYAAWDETGKLFSGTAQLLAYDVLPASGSHVFRNVPVDGEANREVLLKSRFGGRDFYIAVSETMRGRKRLTDSIWASILVPEILLVLVSVFAIFFGVQRGLAPVQLLRDEIASRSQTDLRPIRESPAPTELAPIIHGINELLENLAKAFASHRRFIADAAHQLRTPLASLSSQIEVGLESPPDDIKALLRQLLATTQRTTHLANQLLSLARLEHTEETMFEVATVELHQVFLDASADAVTRAAKKGVELDFDLQPCRIKGSPLMLREMLSNLLDNAVRYTEAGGKVKVSLRLRDESVLLTVEDDGPGVAEEGLAKLGTPFYRLPSSQPDGCGLGLAIVREIVRLHGAAIQFGKGREGRGLLVLIRFPATSPTAEN
jgi:two-component system, OmpR family, sensor histidine kinase TctE